MPKPLPPAEPGSAEADVAAILGALWDAAGQPSIRSLEKAAGASRTSIAGVLAGSRPAGATSWQIIGGLAGALGASQLALARLRELHAKAVTEHAGVAGTQRSAANVTRLLSDPGMRHRSRQQLERDRVRNDLRWARLLAYLRLPDVTEDEIDAVLGDGPPTVT